MSLSKCYTSTPETTNTARLARLILGPCTDVLRDILKSEVLPSDLSRKVKEYTDNLQKQGQRTPLNKAQLEIFFPKPTKKYSGDYSDIDISLLYLLLRNISKIAPHSKGWGEFPYPGDRSVAANIERIRFLRNQYYGHSSDLALSESEFRQEWRNIRDIVVELERHLGTSTVYQDAVNMIKTCSMDPEQEKKYIGLLGDMREVHTNVDILSSNMQSIESQMVLNTDKMETIQRDLRLHNDKMETIERDLMLHNDQMETIRMDLRSHKDKMLPIQRDLILHTDKMATIQKDFMLHTDPTRSRKIETTRRMISIHCKNITPLFVKTRAFERAKELIDNNGYVVIKGNPGTGKTTIAKVLMKELMDEGKTPLQLFRIADIYENISPGDDMVIFIDNVFGELSLSNSDVQEFTTKAEIIKMLIDRENEKKSNSLILTIRTDIEQEYVSKGFNNTFLLSSLVDLSKSAYTLQTDEILRLSKKYELSEYIKDKELISKFSEMPISIGFPQCCHLAKNNEDIKKKLSYFLTNPLMYLRDYIKNLLKHRSAKISVLVYILLSGGKVELNLIESCHLDLTTKRASLEFIGLHTSCINELQDSFLCFDGFLTIHDTITNSIKFSHSLVQECLFSIMFYFDPPKMIQNCHYSLLQTLTTNIEPKNTEAVIGKDLFDDVARRIANIIDERSVNGYTSISLLQLWNDSNFFEHVLETQICFPQFQTCQDINGNSLMTHFAKTGNKKCVEYLLPYSDKRQRYKSINSACSKNKTDIVDLILSSGVECDLQTCFNAVQSGNIELLLRVCEFVDLNQISHSLHPVWSHIRHSLLQEICFMRQSQLIENILKKYPFLIYIKNSQGGNSLHAVASSGDKHVFNVLLSFDLDPYELDENGHNVVFCACQDGKLEMVKYLIEKFPDLLNFHTDFINNSLLYWAAFCGKIDMFEYILNIYENENVDLSLMNKMKPNLDVYGQDVSGKSILHAACKNGHYDMSKYLLSRYPKLLNICDNDGENALHYAASGGNVPLFEYVLSKGINIDSTTNTGRNVLHLCCEWGKKEMSEYLVNKYQNFLYVQENYGWTVLHSACWGGNVEIVNFVINRGLDINALSKNGQSILHVACLSGKFEVCEYIIEKQPKLLDSLDHFDSTVLHYAAMGGNVQLAKMLFDKEIEIRSVNNVGKTILHQSCFSGKIEMCEYLVNKYPDLLDIRDKNGLTVLHTACLGGNVATVSLLVKFGMDINALSNDGESILHMTCTYGKDKVCDYLVNNYQHLLHVKNNFGSSVLHDASYWGHIELVKYFIQKGMDVSLVNKNGETILHRCCRSNQLKMCKYLVNCYSYLLTIRDNGGWTALHSACRQGNVELVSFLIENGMDINALPNDGQTILHLACLNKNFMVFEYLIINYQHLLYVKDKFEQTILHYASLGGHVHIVELLIDKGIDIKTLNETGGTILHECSYFSKVELCEYLVNNQPELLQIRDYKGFTVLHSACWGGSVEIVSFLVKKGMDISGVSNDGQSILHTACLNGRYEVCKYLVDCHPQLLDIQNKIGNSALNYAVFGGHVEILELLIHKGINIESVSIHGETILHQCCRLGKTEICKYLVNHHSDLMTKRSKQGFTALHSACSGGCVEIVSFLLKKGLDINALATYELSILCIAFIFEKYNVFEYLIKNYPELLRIKSKFQNSILYRAALKGNFQIVKLMIENGMDIKSSSKYGETILHGCCIAGNLQLCEYLVNHFSELLEIRDCLGFTALHSACCSGNIRIVLFLIKNGMDTNAISNEGRNILHIACGSGKYDVCEYLVNNQSQLLDGRDKDNFSALHHASSAGNIKIVKLLIAKGMDVTTVNRNGETILHICCFFGREEMCEYLVDNHLQLWGKKTKNGITALHLACFSGNVKIVTYLIKKGFDINVFTNDNQTILHVACLNTKYDVCEYLIKNHPELLNHRCNLNNSLLHFAAFGGNVQIVDLLTETGIDIKFAGYDGDTILHQSCRLGKVEMCKYLVNHYSDLLETRDENGLTVLHSACSSDSVEIVSFLLKKGLDINALSKTGQNILHIACQNGRYEICEFLLDNYPQLLYVENKLRFLVLNHAASGGDVKIITLLRKKGIDINTVAENGETILHHCCRSRQFGMCQYLANNFSDLLDIRDNKGWTVLHSACKGGSVDIVILLIQKGLDINALSIDDQSILHIACVNEKLNVCEYLVENHPHLLKVIDKFKHSVLDKAAWGGNIQILEMLLEKGMDRNSITEIGETILHQCCRSGKKQMCEFIVNRYPEILEKVDNRGYTALHSACCGGSVEILSFLFEMELDVNALTYNGRNILHIACLNGNLKVCEYVVDLFPHLLDSSNSVLHDAAWGGYVQIVKLLIEKGLDVNSLNSNRETILHYCCLAGKLDLCKYLVNHYSFMLDIEDSKGWSVLHSACKGGNAEIVSFLVKKGMDINALSNDGQSILHIACLYGKYDICEFLLHNYSKLIDVRDKFGFSVLHDAAWGGNLQIFNLLIKKGMEITSVANNGETILHKCCRSIKMEMCEYLVNHFPDLLEIRDNNGWTVLHSACSRGSVEIVSFLINKRMDINALSNNGKSILHIACLNGNFNICEFLVQNHPHLLDVRDKLKHTVLHQAVWGENIQMLKILLKRGTNINSVSENGKTVLHECCRSGKKQMCEFIVNHYPDLLEKMDNRGWTALHSACGGGNVEILSFLIEKGLEVNTLTYNGRNILHIACLNGKLKVCEYVVNLFPHLLDSSISVLHDAVWGGYVQIVKLLIETGLDINSVNSNRETILHYCCRAGKLDMCKYLVNHYSFMLDKVDSTGWTVLHSACSGGNVEIVSFLIKRGIDINALSNDDKSILHIACLSGKIEVCEFLLHNYPNLIDVRDKFGFSLLYAATLGGNPQIFNSLTEKGIEITSVAKNGETVLHQCCRFGKKEMCEYLVNHFSDLLEIKDNEGCTVLHTACYGGSVEIVSFLINKGMDINALSHNGKSILHSACNFGNFNICEFLVQNFPHLLHVMDKFKQTVLHQSVWGGNIKILEMLLESGMDINSVAENGETILHQCCLSGKKQMCEFIVNRYPELLQKIDNRGWTALHSACGGGNVEIISFLIEMELDVNALTNNGRNILHIACLNCNLKVCEYVIDLFPHLLDARENLNNSVLHDAAWGGYIQIVKLLIEKGLDINYVNINRETILHYCCLAGKLDLCKYLVNHYSFMLDKVDSKGWSVLHSACKGGNVEILSFLIKKGLNVNSLSNDGESTLHIACLGGKFEVSKYLVENHLHLLEVRDELRNSTLHHAVRGGNVDIAKLLIHSGLNTYDVGRYGETILHKCCRSNKMEMCEYLVNINSDLLEITDYNGWTVLHTACIGGSVEMICVLIEKGLEVNALSNDGQNILHIASINGNYNVCRYLLSKYPHLSVIKDGVGKTIRDYATETGDIDLIQLLIKHDVYTPPSMTVLYERNA